MVKISGVFVVTAFEAGWDNVIATFDPNEVTFEELTEVFPEKEYYIQYSAASKLGDWKDETE